MLLSLIMTLSAILCLSSAQVGHPSPPLLPLFISHSSAHFLIYVVGPGLDLVGRPKFDLTRFNQAFFERMRARVIEAGNHGKYVRYFLLLNRSAIF